MAGDRVDPTSMGRCGIRPAFDTPAATEHPLAGLFGLCGCGNRLNELGLIADLAKCQSPHLKTAADNVRVAVGDTGNNAASGDIDHPRGFADISANRRIIANR